MKKHISEFGFIKRFLLRSITKIQKRIIHWENSNLYYLLARAHFKLWFGFSLGSATTHGMRVSRLAAKRHAKLLVKNVYKNAPKEHKRRIYRMAQHSFRQNILLNEEL